MQAAPIVFTQAGLTYPNGVEALTEISLTIADQSAVAVVGPSGCGKTTLLRTIAGLVRVSTGTLTVAAEATRAMVFQSGLSRIEILLMKTLLCGTCLVLITFQDLKTGQLCQLSELVSC
jgi:ABC-type phosphate/phosphonate transport system ATPase subunit